MWVHSLINTGSLAKSGIVFSNRFQSINVKMLKVDIIPLHWNEIKVIAHPAKYSVLNSI